MRPPVTSDPLAALLGHARWATRQVLMLCRPLTDEQFHRRFSIGPGSLHDALRHDLACLRNWTDYAAGRPVRPTLDEPGVCLTRDDLARLFDEAHDDLAALVERSRGDLGGVIHAPLADPPVPFTRGVALVHALVHGTHHRAQCLNMLRHLDVPGVSDCLPDLDVNDWQYETEVKP